MAAAIGMQRAMSCTCHVQGDDDARGRFLPLDREDRGTRVDLPGDGDRGPTCPRCGHLDRLETWPTAAREAVVAGSRPRREGLGAIDRTSAVGRAAERCAGINLIKDVAVGLSPGLGILQV